LCKDSLKSKLQWVELNGPLSRVFYRGIADNPYAYVELDENRQLFKDNLRQMIFLFKPLTWSMT